MIDQASAILMLGSSAFWAAAIVFMRIGAMMFLLPGFGEAMIPMRLRLAIALCFTLLLVPSLALDPGSDPDLSQLLPYLFTEPLAGVFFGLLLRFFIFALQVAGTIAAQSTSLSQIAGGTPGIDPQPAIGQVLTLAGIALLMISDFHLHVFAYLSTSYQVWPVGTLPLANDLTAAGTAQVAAIFSLGFKLAAPFVLASVLYNVTLGVINRAMPQLMVSFVGAPAITAGGLALLMLSAPIVLNVWVEALRLAMSNGGSIP